MHGCGRGLYQTQHPVFHHVRAHRGDTKTLSSAAWVAGVCSSKSRRLTQPTDLADHQGARPSRSGHDAKQSCVRETGCNRAGRLSAARTADGGFAIDPAELFRAYPPKAADVAPESTTDRSVGRSALQKERLMWHMKLK